MLKSYPKEKPYRSEKYLSWLRKQRPLCCGFGTIESHHMKMFNHAGTGMKSPDNEAIPIPWAVHRDIHNHGERRILCERLGYTKDMLKDICYKYYQKYLSQKSF